MADQNDCRNIQELFPLLFAEVLSDGEANQVTAHLESCSDCRECYRRERALFVLAAGKTPLEEHPEPALLDAFARSSTGLKVSERTEIEAHLAECELCRDLVAKLESLPSSLDDLVDKRGLQAINNLDAKTQNAADSTTMQTLLARLLDALWPRTNYLLRPAIVYLALILLMYPAYIGLRGTDSGGVREIQTLHLTGTRSSRAETLTTSEDLLIRFRFHGAEKNRVYIVTITSERGKVVFHEDRFIGFDETETGCLLFPTGSLDGGQYTVSIKDPQGESPFNVQEYLFRIE